MGDKQAIDAGNENAVVRAVVRPSPNARGRRRGPQPVVPTAEDEILAVLQSPGVVQYLQRWRLLASTLTCRCRRIVQMQVLRQHTDGYAFRCGHCRQKRCLRTGSIFFGSKLSLQTLLRICYKFVEDRQHGSLLGNFPASLGGSESNWRETTNGEWISQPTETQTEDGN
ncbi:hypothetical protein SprV_0200678400 [Sparganum proliferum]